MRAAGESDIFAESLRGLQRTMRMCVEHGDPRLLSVVEHGELSRAGRPYVGTLAPREDAHVLVAFRADSNVGHLADTPWMWLQVGDTLRTPLWYGCSMFVVVPPRQNYGVQVASVAPDDYVQPAGRVRFFGWQIPWDQLSR